MLTVEQQVEAAQAAVRSAQADLDAALARSQALADPVHRLADTIHAQTCRLNHTDDCGWLYEKDSGVDDWSGRDHARYLNKARKVLDLTGSFEQAVEIVEAIGL